MIPRSLTRRQDFRKVYDEGHKLVGRTHVLYFLPAQDDAKAVVASRKVGGAVQRNRGKRLLRAMLQAVIFEEPSRSSEITACCVSGSDGVDANGPNGLWIIAVARHAILDCDIHAVKAECLAMLEHLCGPVKTDPELRGSGDRDDRNRDAPTC